MVRATVSHFQESLWKWDSLWHLNSKLNASDRLQKDYKMKYKMRALLRSAPMRQRLRSWNLDMLTNQLCHTDGATAEDDTREMQRDHRGSVYHRMGCSREDTQRTPDPYITELKGFMGRRRWFILAGFKIWNTSNFDGVGIQLDKRTFKKYSRVMFSRGHYARLFLDPF